jgi:hypothetical protein
MASPARFAQLGRVAVIAAMVAAIARPAIAQVDSKGEDNTRGVRIIDAPTLPPKEDETSRPPAAIELPAPTNATPMRPEAELPPQAPALSPPPAAALSPAMPAVPATPSAPATPNDVANLPKPDDAGIPSAADLIALSKSIKVPNPADLAIEIRPGPNIALGSRVSFRVSTKKAGYIILLDVDSTGKLTQIFPNPMSLIAKGGDQKNANLVRPDKPLQFPDPVAAYSGFEFVASPPTGTAMVIGVLSDRPVQILDLPDIPPSAVGGVSAVNYLAKVAGELRIPDPGGTGLTEPHLSFDAKFYSIR